MCSSLQTSAAGVLLCETCTQAWGRGIKAPNLPGLDSRQALWLYAGSVRRLVVQAKDQPHGAQAWALLLGIKAQAVDLQIPKHAVWTTPPPSWKRRLSHWYLPNFLAAKLAEFHQQPFSQLLQRQRRTRSQGDLDGAERRANLENVFIARRSWLRCRSGSKSTVPQCVVLFDDVSTTGTTLVEAAKALRVMGVQEVHGVSVALVP